MCVRGGRGVGRGGLYLPCLLKTIVIVGVSCCFDMLSTTVILAFVQTASQNQLFSPSTLKPDHMKFDFCNANGNHLQEVVSNGIWTVVSLSKAPNTPMGFDSM